MDLNSPYQRDLFQSFLRDCFLSDEYQISNEPVGSDISSEKVQAAVKIGEDSATDVAVYEISHKSEKDPRVELSRYAFRLLSRYGKRRALIIFTSTAAKNYRLSLVTIEPSISEKGRIAREYSNPRRFSFFLGPDAKTHTPQTELIKKLRVRDFEDLKSRFSIEVVNKQFYAVIAELFTKLAGGKREGLDGGKGLLHLPSVSHEGMRHRYFAVRLIGRLVFCWFLKKKSSDKNRPLVPEEILSSEAVRQNKGYYHTVLEPFFFEALNKPEKDRLEQFHKPPWKWVPFLNGGLFTPDSDDFYELENQQHSKYMNSMVIPDSWFLELFTLFETYNFTIDENTSVDVDLSVDPEMLGRIFENLLAEINPETGESARKSSGSFYTPRAVVDYMVDESLKRYLAGKTTLSEDVLDNLIDYGVDAPPNLTETERLVVIEAVNKIKVMDPACGSGAFPMGILHKLVLILQKVDPDCRHWLEKQLKNVPPLIRRELERKAENENYGFLRKLGIIQNAIFGVDIQPSAVEISRLRFFLSLIVDETVDDSRVNRGLKPLPNLEFKFVCANTLIPLPKSMDQDGFNFFEDQAAIDDLRKLRTEYFSSYGSEKQKIAARFRAVQDRMFESHKKNLAQPQLNLTGQRIKRELPHNDAEHTLTGTLSMWNPFSHEDAMWFDSEWMFGIADGFNVVIGNPPYITLALGRQRNVLSKEQVKQYRELYPDFTEYKGNTFSIFIGLASKMLQPGGTLCYIVPNTLLLANSMQKLRYFVLQNFSIEELVNIRDRVFEEAEIGGNLVFRFTLNQPAIDHASMTVDLENLEDIKTAKRQSVQQILFKKFSDYRFATGASNSGLTQRMSTNVKPLVDIANFYNGIKTGDNKRFLSKFRVNPKYKEVIRGRDVQRYQIEYGNNFVYFDPEKLWSNTNETKLRKTPKIVVRQTGDSIVAALDQQGYLTLDTTHLIFDTTISIKALLAILNSRLMNWFYHGLVEEVGRTFAEVKIVNLKKLPISSAIFDVKRQKELSDLVDKILAVKKRGPMGDVNEFEQQIDQKVYALYGLTPEEIKTVEESTPLSNNGNSEVPGQSNKET